MRVAELSVVAFRNLEPATISLDAPVVVVVGENGQGKTNLLEAVWWLAALRPWRTHRTRELVPWGGKVAEVAGRVRVEGRAHTLGVRFEDRRVATLDGEIQRDGVVWFETLRTVAFAPSDAAIVTEAPELRRAWLDRAAFTARPAHLDVAVQHARLIAQRAALLRQDRPDRTLLDVLDDQVADVGAQLAHRRATLLMELREHLDQTHGHLVDGRGVLRVEYRTAAEGDDVAERLENLRRTARRTRAEELRRRTVLWGVHRDDLAITLDGRALRTFGSRGQVRSAVLAMKLAELRAAHARGQRPVFLLDDLSSELDQGRTQRLVEALIAWTSQVIISTTQVQSLGPHVADPLRINMKNGSVQSYDSSS
jgi:DNA replication and repair protein RecF